MYDITSDNRIAYIEVKLIILHNEMKLSSALWNKVMAPPTNIVLCLS